MWSRRTASGVLVELGAVLMAFCVWYAVFRLVPAYGKMIRTGEGARFWLRLLMVLTLGRGGNSRDSWLPDRRGIEKSKSGKGR